MKLKGIARYPHLFKPSAPEGAEKLKYSVSLLLKKDSDDFNKVKLEIQKEVNEKWGNNTPAKLLLPYNDLSELEPENSILKDYVSVKCATSAEFHRPLLVDQNLEPMIDPSITITGKFIWVDVDISAYDHPLNKGVSIYLRGTLITNEMSSEIPVDALSKKPTAKSMFGEIINTQNNTHMPPSPSSNTTYKMTSKAKGRSREEFINAGWNNESLIKEGYMELPGGVTPSFMS